FLKRAFQQVPQKTDGENYSFFSGRFFEWDVFLKKIGGRGKLMVSCLPFTQKAFVNMYVISRTFVMCFDMFTNVLFAVFNSFSSVRKSVLLRTLFNHYFIMKTN